MINSAKFFCQVFLNLRKILDKDEHVRPYGDEYKKNLTKYFVVRALCQLVRFV